jgi:hypothetical protein
MSLHSHASYPIPDETQRVARAAFPRGTLYLQVADRPGPIDHDAQFAALFPTRGQPAASPTCLALRAGRCWGLCRYRDLFHLKVHVWIPALEDGAQLPVERSHSRL